MNIQRELERDGISGALYHLLWMKNEAFTTNLQLNIPDTLIYFNAKPIFWYYSTKEGLRKKKKEKITNSNIYEYFKSIDPEIGISAIFLYNENKNSGKAIICKYMNIQQLYDFLLDESKPNEGILQRFVLPFGINNCIIQVVWGNEICIFSKRINKKNLNDKRLDIYERCCTFDGPDHYSENVPVKGHLSKFLKKEIQKIVEHISDISYSKFLISRMLLFIKEDIKGKIWILWCSSLRIEGSTNDKKINQTLLSSSLNFLNLNNCPLNLATKISVKIFKKFYKLLKIIIKYKHPANVDTLFSSNALHPLDLQKKIHCLRCNEYQHDKNFIEIPYKLLIKEHDHKIRKEEEFFNLMKTYALNPIEVRNANEEENEILRNLKKSNLFYIKSDNDKIPVLLRRLHPKLYNKEYKEIKVLMEFQEHKILICQDCYMELIQYLQFAGGEENLLDRIKSKAKFQNHKSSDLTIKKLETLKKPFYSNNKIMHDKMKSICSYFRQKRCGASFNFNEEKKSMEIQHKRQNTPLIGYNRKIQNVNSSCLNFHTNASIFNNYASNNNSENDNKSILNYNYKKNLKRNENNDPTKEQVDSLIEMYGENKKEMSILERLENKIKPIIRDRNSKNFKVKYPSTHQFHMLKASLDSTKTHITTTANKSEKEYH